MKRRNGKAPTFEQLLAQTAPHHAGRLMHRAHMANRLAKTVRSSRSRTLVYQVKTDALVALSTRFPDRVALRADARQPRMVVVAVPAARFGLHAPRENFVTREGLR
jgi:hypothetical protein